MAAPKHHLELRAPSRDLRFVALMGDGAPTQQGGVGGWEAVARPRRRALYQWKGQTEPEAWAVPVLIDGWPNESVEPDITKLLRMAGSHAGPEQDPPELTVDGVSFGVDRRPHARWVIATL